MQGLHLAATLHYELETSGSHYIIKARSKVLQKLDATHEMWVKFKDQIHSWCGKIRVLTFQFGLSLGAISNFPF